MNNVPPAWDLLAGVNVALAILARSAIRRMTGEGQLLRLALSDMALATAGNLGYIAEAQVNRSERPRLGNSIYGTFGRDFETADGARVMVVAFTVKQWEALVAATETGSQIHALEAALNATSARRRTATRRAPRSQPSWSRGSGATSWPISAARSTPHGACWGPDQTLRQLVALRSALLTGEP